MMMGKKKIRTESAEGTESATGTEARMTVLEYAVAMNPDEDWDVCCMCEVTEKDAPYGLRLRKALVLLEDNTLARSAWCYRLTCSDNYYQSIKLTGMDVLEKKG